MLRGEVQSKLTEEEMSSQFLQLRNDRLKKETGIPRYLGMELKKRHMLLKEFSVTSD